MKMLSMAATVLMLAGATAARAVEAVSSNQLVTLRALTGPVDPTDACPNLGNHFHQILPDATVATAPFVVPAGSALVATSVEWIANNADAGDTVVGLLLIERGTNTRAVVVSSAVADGLGNTGGSATVPSGVRLRPGVDHSICFNPQEPSGSAASLTGQAILHGFVVRER